MINSFITPCIVLLTGASGSGKTTVLQELSKHLDKHSVKIFHFDDIGVPSFEDMLKDYGSAENWQQEMTEKWIEKLSHIKDVQFIFLEGSFNPDFAIKALQKYTLKKYRLFCIHSDRNVREKRLQYLRCQPELITDDMENFACFLKRKTIELGGLVVNNNGSSETVVLEILEKLND